MSARHAVAAVLSLGVGAGALFCAPPAFADGLPPVHASKTTVLPNEPFTLSGTGCVSSLADYFPNGHVSVVGGPSAPEVDTDAGGNWSVTARSGTTFNVSFAVQVLCTYRAADGSSQDKMYPPLTMRVVGGQDPYPTYAPKHADVPTPAPSGPGQVPASRSQAATPAVTPAPPSPSPVPPPVAAPVGPVAPTPGVGCIACARIASGAPLGPGWPVSLRYAGFQPSEQVTLVMHSTPVGLGTFTADASGVVVASVRIPDGATAGSHTLTFSGTTTGDRTLPFTVSSAVPQAAHATPAESAGHGGFVLPAAGVVLVFLGAVAAVSARRRRRVGRSGPGVGAPPGRGEA